MIAKKQRLDQILFNRNLAESKTKAQAMIMAGQVFVEGKPISKSGFNINHNATIEIKNLGPKWVSRGAIKLITALEKNKIVVKNKICIDLGSSTGGFTDVLIQSGANKVYAVDVGTNQLHEKLKKNNKIISLEKTNARYLKKEQFEELIDIMVCDVSFISLKKILPEPIKLCSKNAIIIALIKPQFEVGKKYISKGGVVKDNDLRNQCCQDIRLWFENIMKYKVSSIIESPITGPKGNVEYLLFARK